VDRDHAHHWIEGECMDVGEDGHLTGCGAYAPQLLREAEERIIELEHRIERMEVVSEGQFTLIEKRVAERDYAEAAILRYREALEATPCNCDYNDAGLLCHTCLRCKALP